MRAATVLLVLSVQGAHAAWDVRDCAGEVRDRHGIRIEVAMQICAGSQAKQAERRRCVIRQVKTKGMSADDALSTCLSRLR